MSATTTAPTTAQSLCKNRTIILDCAIVAKIAVKLSREDAAKLAEILTKNGEGLMTGSPLMLIARAINQAHDS